MKDLINKYLRYILVTIIFFLIIVNIRSCVQHKSEVKAIAKDTRYEELMYKHNISTLEKTVNKQGEEITSQKALVLTKDQEKEALLLENKRLKRIKSEVKVITKTTVKEVFVPYEVTVYDSASGDSAKPFIKLDKWYGISGVVLKQGVRFDSVTFKNELVVTLGNERQGLLKKSIPTVDVTNKNPFSSTKEMYNVVIVPNKKKPYETRGAAFVAGAAAMLYAVIKLSK